MGNVQSHKLKRDTRIGNYRVKERIGGGWEGEVYKVEEVPTESIRALKLFRTDELWPIRNLAHKAWYYEQLRCTRHFPIYHHYGQWFFDDDNGCWFLVFEYIKGIPIKKVAATYSPSKKEKFYLDLASAVADVHARGKLAIGDFSSDGNVILTEEGRVIFVDCNPGSPDEPNKNFKTDCKEELFAVAKQTFGRSKPSSVINFLKEIDSNSDFTPLTLKKILKRANKYMHADIGQSASPCQ